MKLRPLNDTILVIPDDNEFVDSNPEIVKILKNGIIKIPEAYEGLFKKIPMAGTIISWGSTCKYSYNAGERVVYGRFAGAKFNLEGKSYLILKEQDLLAKEENGM